MKGRAPKSPWMGFQIEVRKKLRPNLCRAKVESCQSSTTSRIETSTTDAANKKVIRRAISSPSRRRERNEREPAAGPALGTVVNDVATLFQSLAKSTESCQWPSILWTPLVWEAWHKTGLPRSSGPH